MIKKFLDYLKEAVDLNPILGKDEIPLSFGDENDKILRLKYIVSNCSWIFNSKI